MKRRMLSIICALALCLGLLPSAAFAAADGSKAIQLVDSGTAANISGGQVDSIYFGTYQQSSNGSGGYNTDPIKWRVLSNSDGKLFLLSDQNLDVKPYNSSSTGITWEKSTIRSWLNGYEASENNSGTDYSSNNFIDAAFSSDEQVAIADTYVYNKNNLSYSTSGGENTTDQIFLLSIEEANNSSYFPNGNNSRKSTNTAYVASYRGMLGAGEADYWWLRSPGKDDDYAAFVDDGGVVYNNGYIVVHTNTAVRPAFHLDLNSVLFTSAAAGGKSASGMDSGLTAVGGYDGNEWKLTLLDDSRDFDVTETDISGDPGDTITLHYTRASTGDNEYISVILADDSGAQYYGRIAKPTTADGNISLTIPDTLAEGTYTLNVFSEQYNGDYKTDYASAFAEVTLTVDITAPTLSAGSATRDSATTATVKFTSDEAGTYYYAVMEKGADEPADIASGVGTDMASGENTINLTNLTAGTKDIYIVAKDAMGNVSQTLQIVIPEFIPTYTISASPAALNFSKKTVGYTEAPDGQTVTITNTGNQTVTVTLPTSTNYTITAGTGFFDGTATLAPNGTATFAVQPKTGLAVGSYSETLTISSKHNTSAEVSLAFTVDPKSLDGAQVQVSGSYIYDGNAKEPSGENVTVTLHGEPLTENTDYTLSYEDNTDAGEATVKVSGTGNYSGTVTDTFTIDPAPLTITGVTAEGRAYDGSNTVEITDVTLDGVKDGDDVSVNTSSLTGTLSSANAGTYTELTLTGTVNLTGDDKDNYTLTLSTEGMTVTNVNDESGVTISQAESTISIKDTYTPSKTYDGTALAVPTAEELKLSGAVYTDVEFTWYKGTSADGAKLDSAPADAGTYYLVASISESNNTSASEATSEAITISPKLVSNPTITLSGTSFEYTGSEIKPTVTVKDGETVIPASEYTVEYSNNTNVGTATVTIKDVEGGNYTVSGSTTFEITKAKATVTTAPEAVTGLTYDGQPHALVTAGEAIGGTMQYSTEENGAYSTDIPTGTHAGDYSVWYYVEGDENHSDTQPVEVKVTIAKATPDYTVPTGLAATYGDTLSNVNLADGWAWDDDTAPVGNVGSNTFSATFTPDDTDNYNTVTENLTVTVSAKDITGAVITLGGSLTYTGQQQTQQIASVTVDGLTVTYTVTGNTGTDAGDYTLTVTGTDNFTGTAAKGWSISKATYSGDIGVSSTVLANHSGEVELPGIPDGASYGAASYDGTDGAVKDLSIEGSVLSYTGGDGIQKGQIYKITVPVSGAKNYVDYNITVTLTGTDKAQLEITGVQVLTGLVYNGQTQAGYTGTPSAEGYTGNFTVTYDTTDGKAPTNAGNYTVTIAIPKDNTQYVGSMDLQFTIAPKPLTVSAPSASVYVGDSAPKLALTYTGLVDGESVTPSQEPDFTITKSDNTVIDLEDAVKTVGTYTITWSNAGNTTFPDGANYAIQTETTGTLTVSTRSSGGGSSSNTTTETTKNPDGSTTTTVTNKNTGTVTETTKWSDGSQEVVETKKDGTVTTTTTDTAGNQTQVVENPDGSSKTTVDNKNGSGSVTLVDENGQVVSEATLFQSAVAAAQEKGEAVALPMPEVPITTDRETAPTVTVDLPSGTSAKVEIPVENVTSGTVAVIVKADGTEEVIKTSLTTENGVAVTLSDGDTVKVVDNSKTFDDVSDNYWGAEAVDFAVSRELFAGTSATTFSPNTAMNRAMIVTVLARFEGVDTATGSTWYEAGQQWAMENGISDGSNMEQGLTREQLATMLYRYAQSKGYDTTQGGMAIREYADFEQISGYAAEAMTWAVNTGIINGTSSTTLSPQGPATRAQVATILMRFIEGMA